MPARSDPRELPSPPGVQFVQEANMSMNVGGPGGRKAEINMTPMIDVLLVLIIIFMVITPTKSRGLTALVPQQATEDPVKPVPSRDIVISVARENVIHLNQDPVDFAALRERLEALYFTAAGAHLFVRGDRDLAFQDVAQVIDIARGAGWQRIGLMTR
jgi:biopolymer transport protein ExbD